MGCRICHQTTQLIISLFFFSIGSLMSSQRITKIIRFLKSLIAVWFFNASYVFSNHQIRDKVGIAWLLISLNFGTLFKVPVIVFGKVSAIVVVVAFPTQVVSSFSHYRRLHLSLRFRYLQEGLLYPLSVEAIFR